MNNVGPAEPEEFLRSLFDRAVMVADPMRIIPHHLPLKPPGRVVVIGAGKASARMAEAVETVWGPCEGLVITRYGYGRPTRGVEIVEAAHPVPDEAGLSATTRILQLLHASREGDFVLALISGGASALLVQPSGDITLSEKQSVNAALLASGAPIHAMNTVRKHLSKVKGGQLSAAAFPAQMLTLMISDVPGDNPAFIGSGPTVGELSSAADANQLLRQWNITVPASVMHVLEQGSTVLCQQDSRLSATDNRIIAAPSQSLQAAVELARSAGCRVEVIGEAVEGEARDVARQHAAVALKCIRDATPGGPPLLLLSGGELTVTRRGNGIGGPNAEYALALALALDGAAGIHAIACDTDGVDGAAEVAGAIIGPDTLTVAKLAGIDASVALDGNDAHRFFAAVGGQVVTGPTLTNVNDFRAILILPPG